VKRFLNLSISLNGRGDRSFSFGFDSNRGSDCNELNLSDVRLTDFDESTLGSL
jgi:hypothetical protein